MHFATGIMGLCMMLTGMASGYIQEAVGYQTFFIIVMVVSAVPVIATFFAPFFVQEEEDKVEV